MIFFQEKDTPTSRTRYVTKEGIIAALAFARLLSRRDFAEHPCVAEAMRVAEKSLLMLMFAVGALERSRRDRYYQ